MFKSKVIIYIFDGDVQHAIKVERTHLSTVPARLLRIVALPE
jgi:hypothetical protein